MNKHLLKIAGLLYAMQVMPAALAVEVRGDFNGDGYSDLVIANSTQSFFGSTSEAPPEISSAGAVHVMFGTEDGLLPENSQFIYQDTPGVLGVAEAGDYFGSDVISGDFNGDGFADLAISADGEDLGSLFNAGSVNVLYGSVTGLRTDNDQYWHQNSRGVRGVAEAKDRFGNALAAGDFNADGYADLAIGVSGESVGNIESAGAVNVLFGSVRGLTAVNDQLWHQNTASLLDEAEAQDEFGKALVANDFDGDGFADLVVGVVGQKVGTAGSAGAVHFLRGGPDGLNGVRDRVIHQNTPGIAGVAEPDDGFGSSLASGDFNADGRADLVVGSSKESVGSVYQAGAVNILYGAAVSGITTLGDQIWHQGSPSMLGSPEFRDLFGAALAVADFDQDGYADLAIGIPYEEPGSVGSSLEDGAIAIMFGSGSGLRVLGNQLIDNFLPDTFQDAFGASLAVGDFNGDQFPDLAVGAPSLVWDGGQIVIMSSNHAGPTGGPTTIWTPDHPELYGAGESEDQWGRRLTSQ